jgi:hypothetical protein
MKIGDQFRERLARENPSVAFRYFRIDGGPVMDAAAACLAQRKAAYDAWNEFLKENGASLSQGYANGRLIGFGSKTPPAGDAWKLDAKVENLWVPNRKTKAGRALAEAMKKLPTAPSFHGAFADFGLPDYPLILDGRQWFRPTMFGVVGKTIWIKIAWKAYSAELLALYAKARRNKGDLYRSEELDFLLDWKPAEGMVEVKEWEAIRDCEALLA